VDVTKKACGGSKMKLEGRTVKFMAEASKHSVLTVLA
jgi:hypothetical protein